MTETVKRIKPICLPLKTINATKVIKNGMDLNLIYKFLSTLQWPRGLRNFRFLNAKSFTEFMQLISPMFIRNLLRKAVL